MNFKKYNRKWIKKLVIRKSYFYISFILIKFEWKWVSRIWGLLSKMEKVKGEFFFRTNENKNKWQIFKDTEGVINTTSINPTNWWEWMAHWHAHENLALMGEFVFVLDTRIIIMDNTISDPHIILHSYKLKYKMYLSWFYFNIIFLS